MTTKGYSDFLDDMGKLLQTAMPRTDRERDELYEAEAEVRRLRSQLAIAEEFFAAWAASQPLRDFAPLRGRDLACWCPLDQPCHADVLLELANSCTDS